mmetsp:Transcript_318/g.962  ORF Transcript_318/g.962 Transcript_318/m.962 type:complete len:111 (-) Transcript_318:557-889(-)
MKDEIERQLGVHTYSAHSILPKIAMVHNLGILTDEMIAINAEFFHGPFRSTLSLMVADARNHLKGPGTTYLPEALPYYGLSYPGAWNSSCRVPTPEDQTTAAEKMGSEPM